MATSEGFVTRRTSKGLETTRDLERRECPTLCASHRLNLWWCRHLSEPGSLETCQVPCQSQTLWRLLTAQGLRQSQALAPRSLDPASKGSTSVKVPQDAKSVCNVACNCQLLTSCCHKLGWGRQFPTYHPQAIPFDGPQRSAVARSRT